MRTPYLPLVLVILWGGLSSAQVPQYQQTPFTSLSGLQSLDVNTRQAAALALARFTNNAGVVNALIAPLHQDPSVVVRQSAAAALSKMGQQARATLAYAAICDPDASIRNGLASHARRAKGIQCHESPALPDTRARLPQDASGLVAYLQHPSPATRKAAAKELARMQSAQGYQAIWNMMTKDPVAQVRGSSIRMLARVYTTKLLPVLQFVLTRDPDSRVRMVALEALAFLKVPSTVNWLAASVKFEPQSKMQRAGVKALEMIGTRSAAQALAAICESHASDETRAAAVTALNALKAHRTIAHPVIARVLAQDRSGKVRAAAMKALTTDHSASACAARAQRINDPDGDVRQAVVEQLGNCPARIALPALTTAARSDREAKVRDAALTLLIKAGPARARDTILAVLANDAQKEIRLKALKALFKLAPRDQGAPLAEVAKRDPEAELRRLAVKALAKQPMLVAVPALDAVLKGDRDANIRLWAAAGLSRFKDGTAYQALQKAATEDASEKVRKLAAKGAAKSPAQKAWVDSLLPQTIDNDPNVRLRAVTQLCALQVPRTYRALVRSLWVDENSTVRTAVARCFAEIDHPLVDIGLSVAHDTDPDPGAIQAVEASQKRRVERLTQLLEELKSPSAEKRLEAVRQLQPSPNPQVRQALELRLTKDEDVNVRRSAAARLFRYMDRAALNKLLRASQSEPDLKLRSQAGQLYTRLSSAWGAGRKPLNINTLILQVRATNRKGAVWAAKALGALKDRRAFQPLKEAAKSEDPALRHAAVVALATFGDMTIVSEAARTEEHKQVKEQLIQLNFLRRAEAEKVIAALQSTDVNEVFRGLEAASVHQVNKAVPWVVRLALSHISMGVRQAAVRTLVLYDLPLAQWAIRVAAQNDASKRLRQVMWLWAVHVDGAAS